MANVAVTVVRAAGPGESKPQNVRLSSRVCKKSTSALDGCMVQEGRVRVVQGRVLASRSVRVSRLGRYIIWVREIRTVGHGPCHSLLKSLAPITSPIIFREINLNPPAVVHP